MTAAILDGPESVDPLRRDATLYSGEVSLIFNAFGGCGWKSGCGVTATTPASLARVIAAGAVWVDAALVTVAQQTVGPVAPHASLDRWAVWSVDAAGLGHLDQGVPALEPLVPRLSSRAILRAEIIRAAAVSLTGVPTLDFRFPLRAVASEPPQTAVANTTGGSVTVSSDASFVTVTVTSDTVLHLATGRVGVPVRVLFVQNNVGGWDVTSVVSGDGPVLWAGGTAISLLAAPGAATLLTATWDGTRWLCEFAALLLA